MGNLDHIMANSSCWNIDFLADLGKVTQFEAN